MNWILILVFSVATSRPVAKAADFVLWLWWRLLWLVVAPICLAIWIPTAGLRHAFGMMTFGGFEAITWKYVSWPIRHWRDRRELKRVVRVLRANP